jgi:tRNA 2-thiouridine synthesizing protein B
VILHTLCASPASAAFRDCLKVLGKGDVLVLMGDGVYAALQGTEAHRELRDCPAELHVLEADALLAGVAVPAEGVHSIDMNGLVTLTERFPRQQAWY